MEKVILIVEDSPTIRYHVKTLVGQMGMTLREAGGELGLFNLIEEYGRITDLILMDLTLKHEDGFTLISKLRDNALYKHIPIIVLTEHADMEHVLAAKKLGVNGYIRKPLNKELFIAKIKEVLGT